MKAPVDFDFAAWQAEYKARRAARKVELIEALRAGKKVLHHGRIWPDVAKGVFVPSARTPEYLGEHIENREGGFGFATRILEPGDDSPEVREAQELTDAIVETARLCTPPEDFDGPAIILDK